MLGNRHEPALYEAANALFGYARNPFEMFANKAAEKLYPLSGYTPVYGKPQAANAIAELKRMVDLAETVRAQSNYVDNGYAAKINEVFNWRDKLARAKMGTK